MLVANGNSPMQVRTILTSARLREYVQYVREALTAEGIDTYLVNLSRAGDGSIAVAPMGIPGRA